MVIVVAYKAPSSISLPFLTVSWFRYQYDSYVHQGKLTPSSRERLFWIKMIPSPWLQWWSWNSKLICTYIPLATGTASGATWKWAWMKKDEKRRAEPSEKEFPSFLQENHRKKHPLFLWTLRKADVKAALCHGKSPCKDESNKQRNNKQSWQAGLSSTWSVLCSGIPLCGPVNSQLLSQ